MEYIKTAKNGSFCEEWLSENDFEAVLATFFRYYYGANASEAVQNIATDQKDCPKCSRCIARHLHTKYLKGLNLLQYFRYKFFDLKFLILKNDIRRCRHQRSVTCARPSFDKQGMQRKINTC